MNFKNVLEHVPDYKVFLTVDEMDESSKKLKEEYPDLVDLWVCGYSRKGHPIYCLKIGDGPKNALMFGCPHPNEPMGAMMLEFFTRELCENKEFRENCGYTWYLIKSIDIDGTMLNEGWFKGPFSITNYAKNFFRPVGYEQVEWTFPIDYKTLHFDKPIPETKALMKIIDDIKPDFLYSLHNAGFGGAYWYITKDIPELYEGFHNAARSRKMPLSLGEPEAPYIKEFAPAIFEMMGIEDNYDYIEQFAEPGTDIGSRIECGTSSDGYAKKYGTISLVGELPYFYSPKIESDKILDFTRLEAAKKSAEIKLQEYGEIRDEYYKFKDIVSDDNPFAKMVNMMTEHLDESVQMDLKHAESEEAFTKPCKESEAFDSIECTKFYCLINYGLLIRACKFEIDKHDDKIAETLKAQVKELQEKFDFKASQLEKMEYSLVPIQTLVRIQLESGLLVADWIEKNK